jgi:hypothetical protein
MFGPATIAMIAAAAMTRQSFGFRRMVIDTRSFY